MTRALAEDLGRAGDVTSIATIPDGTPARAVVVARKAGTIAGLPLVAAASASSRPTSTIKANARDGDTVAAKTALMTIAGDARAVLSAERAALNLLGHLSGIATATPTSCALAKATARPASAARARPRRACARWRNTRCAAAAASITASVSTTPC